MTQFSEIEKGNLIHLNGPGLIPSTLVNNFRNLVADGRAAEESKNRLFTRFDRDLLEYPAFLWESNGLPFAFFIYKMQQAKVELLWSHQLTSLFPIEPYFRPATEALIEAFLDDLRARTIISQFSSWSHIIGLDLLATTFPEIGIRRFDLEIMDLTLTKRDLPELPDLPPGLRLTNWEPSRTDEAAELMMKVGDSFIRYAKLSAADCREYLESVMDPRLSRFVVDHENNLVSFVNFNATGWIGQIFSREDYQGRGIGRFLMIHALHVLQEKRARKASLAVLSDNFLAKDFYNSLGFETVLTHPIWAWNEESENL